MQPLQQTGPLVALRFVLLGDPDEASLTAVVLFIGGPEMTAPELIFSSILGSRSDKLLR